MDWFRGACSVLLTLLFSCGSAQSGGGGGSGLGCPEGAAPDRAGLCHCRPERISLFGACLPAAKAAELCTRAGAALEKKEGAASSCVPIHCEEGAVADEATGKCAGPSELRGAALRRNITLGEKDALGCAGGKRLRMSGGLAFCAPKEDPCGPMEMLDKEMCLTLPTCDAGYVLDPRSSKCIRLTVAGREVPTFDVGSWTRCSIGADGGEASHVLCAALSRDANSNEGAALSKWAIDLELQFPNNEIASADARFAISTAEGMRAPSWLNASTARALESLLAPLRAMGGSASAASVSARVWCTVRQGSPPIALPL